jgi:hypothetical protein
LIFSSAENSLRVLRLMSRTMLLALCFLPPASLIALFHFVFDFEFD